MPVTAETARTLARQAEVHLDEPGRHGPTSAYVTCPRCGQRLQEELAIAYNTAQAIRITVSWLQSTLAAHLREDCSWKNPQTRQEVDPYARFKTRRA